MAKEVAKLEKVLGIKFKDKNLILQSIVHRSYINEHKSFVVDHNERLEFLGDAVLEIVVTEHIYKNYPNPEGELTNWRASLVNSVSLADVAKKIKLGDYILLSKGEEKDKNTKARESIMANAVEAVIGAIYLDQGTKAAEKFIHKYMISKLDYIIENKLFQDPKSKFQEIAQEKTGTTPHYKIMSESGPDHAKHFKVAVFLNKEMIAIGEGDSKQEAQVEAAHKGLDEKGWN